MHAFLAPIIFSSKTGKILLPMNAEVNAAMSETQGNLHMFSIVKERNGQANPITHRRKKV